MSMIFDNIGIKFSANLYSSLPFIYNNPIIEKITAPMKLTIKSSIVSFNPISK